MLNALIRNQADPGEIVARNFGAVITHGESRLLTDKDSHPNPADPWLRYAGKGILFVPNPNWSEATRSDLKRHGLIFLGDLGDLLK